jgi:hypothetical protein
MFNLTHDVEAEDLQKVATAIPVKAWHNHSVHIARHTSFMMEPQFDDLQTSHPEIVRLFDEHLAMHQQEADKQMQQKMQMLLAAKGAPDGKPAGQQAQNPLASQNGGGEPMGADPLAAMQAQAPQGGPPGAGQAS